MLALVLKTLQIASLQAPLPMRVPDPDISRGLAMHIELTRGGFDLYWEYTWRLDGFGKGAMLDKAGYRFDVTCLYRKFQ